MRFLSFKRRYYIIKSIIFVFVYAVFVDILRSIHRCNIEKFIDLYYYNSRIIMNGGTAL